MSAEACAVEPVEEVELGRVESEVAGFIDACVQPGTTKPAFTPTSDWGSNDEGVTAALDLPFSFTLYGTSHSKYWITSNGQLGFGDSVGGSLFGHATCPLPSSSFSTPIVLVYSTDLVNHVDPGTGICTAITGTPPNRKFVVTWKDASFYDAWGTSWVTFSAILNEGTNVIDVILERVDSPYFIELEGGTMAVLGKQAGSSGSTYSCYEPNAPEGTVIHYNP